MRFSDFMPISCGFSVLDPPIIGPPIGFQSEILANQVPPFKHKKILDVARTQRSIDCRGTYISKEKIHRRKCFSVKDENAVC